MQGLNTLFQSDPLAQEVGLAQIMQERQKNNLGMDRMRQQMGFDQKMNPLKLEEQRLGNQTTQAKLPGIFTANEDAALDLDKKRQTQQATIDDLLKSYKSKDAKRDLEELTQAGEAFGQAGQYMKSLPPGLKKPMAKKLLGQYWQPEFDNFSETYLMQVLESAGTTMSEARQKFQQQMKLQDDKQAFTEAENEKKRVAAQQLAEYKTKVQQEIAKARAADLPTREKVLGSLAQAMIQETDPDAWKILKEQYDMLATQITAEKMAIAQARGAGGIDAGAVGGLPTKPLPSPPTLPNQMPGAAPVQPAVPLGSPAQGSPAARPSLQELQKMYPGVPVEKLKEAYKKKFGIDIQ